MPSWFKKVFKNQEKKAKPSTAAGPAAAAQAVTKPATLEEPVLGEPDTSAYEEERPKQRNVVEAPVIMPDEETSSWSEEIRIKGQVDRDMTSCVFLVDRPVLDGYSVWMPGPEWAEEISPLAQRLFEIDGVGSVLLHNMTVTVTLAQGKARPWEELAAQIGQVIREHLKDEKPVVTDAFLDQMPPEEEIRQRVQKCVDLEINPGIAAHSGVVTLERVEGNTVYITMGGGCQGCAASAITLRQGIHQSFRQSVPQIGAIYDETDHTAGTNPYFKELPAGMA